MRKWSAATLVVIAMVGSIAACSAPATPRPDRGAADQKGATPKRIVAAIRGVPPSLAGEETNRTSGNFPGLDAITELVHASLVHADDRGALRPELAEEVPSLDNGLWQLFPDGRMMTTLVIKPNARWHDGTPLTTDDLTFTAIVEQDKSLGIPRARVWDFVESIEPRDQRTIVVTWSAPYIDADATFSFQYGLPLPRHLLEAPYATNHDAFLSLSYWTNDFVGAGPYRMQQWVPDSSVVLERNDDYALGRAAADQIEVRFIQDPTAVVGSLLAGVVDMTLGRSLIPLDQAELVASQRGDMRVATSLRSWYPIHAQFIDADPPIVTNAQFRKALIQAIDRQGMADTFIGPKTSVAHSYVSPDTPGYELIEPSIVKYGYDPRRAAAMIEDLGYTQGTDGLFVGTDRQRLHVEIRTTTRAELQPKIVAAVVDDWRKLGVDAEQVNIPPQRMTDREYRSTFPAFEMPGGENDVTPELLMRFHSSTTPLPQNQYQIGNYSRHQSAELDSYIEHYITTIPTTERLEWLARFAHYESDVLPTMGLFYQVDAALVANRIQGVTGQGRRASQAWNVEEWQLTS